MKVPLSWLRELVDIEADLDELVEVMGRNGLEVEEVTTPGGGVEGVRVARVLDVVDHPEADKLVVVTLDDGDGERTVLAGARNLAPGDLVPLAVPGARLPRGLEIDRREMRGIVSDGMVCSPRELEVADDHSGIMVLDVDVAPGSDIHDVLPLGDPVIEVAVPADRGDLHSVHGIARDLAAILDVEPRLPGEAADRSDGDVPIRIEAADGCSRYVGWVVDGLAVGPSPWWLRRRLEACGVRSLTNLVDITNYVMLERGQPLHAFDLDALRGPEIVVRWARAGEELRTLDGRPRTLVETDLVIADAERAVALAGVMGGEETEVGPATTRILLESAAFDPAAVRRTSRRLGLLSEASIRFERRVDWSGSWAAATRAVELLTELAGGTDRGARAGGDGEPPPSPIRLDARWTASFLGLDGLQPDAQAALLRRAGLQVEEGETDELLVTPPTWRADITRPADAAEEIARLYGYEEIPAELPPVTLLGGLSPRQRAEREIRSRVLAAGFHEAQTSPFVGDDALVLLAPEDPGRVRLQNPLAKDTAVMRPSLAEGLLGAARRNAGQGRDGLALFEVGRVFREVDGPLDKLLAADAEGGTWQWYDPDGVRLPTQPVVLGLVAYGTKQGERWLDRSRPWTVFDLLAAVDAVAERLSGRSSLLERVPTERPRLHPGRTALLRWDGRDIGVVGQLHPLEAEARDLPDETAVGEILLDPLWGPVGRGELGLRTAPTLARRPAIHVDVAVVVAEDVSYEAVEAAVRRGAGDLLDRLQLFDEYRGAQVGEGRRSLAFHLRLQAPDRQLTDADADRAIDAVSEAVSDVGGTLRR